MYAHAHTLIMCQSNHEWFQCCAHPYLPTALCTSAVWCLSSSLRVAANCACLNWDLSLVRTSLQASQAQMLTTIVQAYMWLCPLLPCQPSTLWADTITIRWHTPSFSANDVWSLKLAPQALCDFAVDRSCTEVSQVKDAASLLPTAACTHRVLHITKIPRLVFLS